MVAIAFHPPPKANKFIGCFFTMIITAQSFTDLSFLSMMCFHLGLVLYNCQEPHVIFMRTRVQIPPPPLVTFE